MSCIGFAISCFVYTKMLFTALQASRDSPCWVGAQYPGAALQPQTMQFHIQNSMAAVARVVFAQGSGKVSLYPLV